MILVCRQHICGNVLSAVKDRPGHFNINGKTFEMSRVSLPHLRPRHSLNSFDCSGCGDASCYNKHHYSDVIMSAMVYQIISLTIVDSTVLFRPTSKKTSKLRVTGLCEGNSPVTGELPAQRASNAKMFPFDDVIMATDKCIDMCSIKTYIGLCRIVNKLIINRCMMVTVKYRACRGSHMFC